MYSSYLCCPIVQDPGLVIKQMVADGNFWNGFRCEEDQGLVARSALEVGYLDSYLLSCVFLGKLHNFSVPQFI